MDVGCDPCLCAGGKFRKAPEHGGLDRAIDIEMPALVGDFGRETEVERRPVPGQMLARRQALLLGPRHLAGEETAFLCPALLAARQLGIRRRLFGGHVACSYSCRYIADSCLVSRMVE